MIEVLVTLILISIGVLGMVALQSRTVQYTQDAVQRNSAALLANDLVELMRAMPTGMPGSSGFYKAAEAEFADTPDSCTPMPNNTAQQLACWSEKAKLALPGAEDLLEDEFYVCRFNEESGACDTSNGKALEIQLAWRVKKGECADNLDGTVCRYRLRTRI